MHCKPLIINQPHIHKLEGTSLFRNSYRISQPVSGLFSAGYIVSKDQSLENTRSGDGRSRVPGAGISEMSIYFTEGLAQ